MDRETDPLDDTEYEADELVVTRRQAEVLALREQGLTQADIADRFGTSRANVANIEASARENAEKARNTVDFLERLRPLVELEIDAHTSLFDVPPMVYSACDEADIKVSSSAVDLVQTVRSEAGEAISGNVVTEPIRVLVTESGDVRVVRD
ncbi:Tfx family DNA-binding protein [Halapricum desulfuricans]|uniref:Transcriptional regulator n=1 Tax=Halapricum desulfuricans TaxID=2841257 RepID=A0A897N773_9EURY|nr:Tfx family DNA-binding protein [Halapricum desulfuricans]QSG08557.1 Transcriptional regulator [Halapricum desulfuricans]QSG11512.1 Transcriptional regulator [Halapricum desulfuricans]